MSEIICTSFWQSQIFCATTLEGIEAVTAVDLAFVHTSIIALEDGYLLLTWNLHARCISSRFMWILLFALFWRKPVVENRIRCDASSSLGHLNRKTCRCPILVPNFMGADCHPRQPKNIPWGNQFQGSICKFLVGCTSMKKDLPARRKGIGARVWSWSPLPLNYT